MPSSTTWIIAGIGIGVGIGIGAVLLFRDRPDVDVDAPPFEAASQSREPAFVTHNVIRDNQGRITSIETVRHIGEGGIGAGTSGSGQTPVVHPDEA